MAMYWLIAILIVVVNWPARQTNGLSREWDVSVVVRVSVDVAKALNPSFGATRGVGDALAPDDDDG